MSKKRLLIASILAALSSQTISAQNFTVSNTNDSGAGSLRQAISDSNAFNGAATINFSITNSTVNLSSMLPILTNPNGITINGNGNTINGGSTSNITGDRVFFIGVPDNTPAAGSGFLPSTAATNWNINNLNIQNGNARGGHGASGGGGGAGLGGGIFLNAGNLTLSSVNFSNNRAIGGNGNFGGSIGGGGGMGGNGGSQSGGGFGLGANGGGSGANGLSGSFLNGASGGSGNGTLGGLNGGGGGGANSLGQGSGGGGGIGGQNWTGTGTGNGGFGGGGGGSGSGGYGGGGGTEGDGGFGGGGGTAGDGGFGGGNGGGGGLGAGGAIFVRKGATLTLSNGGITGSTIAGGTGSDSGQAIGSGIFLAGAVNYNVTTGNTITISDTLGGGFNSEITGGFTKSGAGTLVLTGANSYTGGTTLAGTAGSILRLGSNTALGDATNSLTMSAGNTLDLNGNSINTGSLSGTGVITNTSTTTAATITVGNDDGTSTFSGVIQNGAQSVALVKAGSGALTLTGNNSYSGGTTLAGTTGSVLRVGNPNALGAVTNSLTINGGNTLDLNGFGIAIGALTGSGTVTNTNTSLGSFLQVGVGNVSSVFDGAVQSTRPLTLSKLGTGTLTLTGISSSYTGTEIYGGTLSVSHGGSLGNASLDFYTNSGTIQFTGSNAVKSASVNLGSSATFDIINSNSSLSLLGNISGAGSLTKTGAGTLVLAGVNTHTGGTTINAGALSVSSEGSLGGTGAFTINGGRLQITGTSFTSITRPITWGANGGSLDIADAANTVTLSQAVTTAGSLTKLGAGTLVLTGNSNTGGATVSAGVLQIGNGSAAGTLASGTATINAGATLRYYRNDLSTISTNFSGTGTLNYFGTGNLNESTYSPNGNNSAFTGTVQIGNSAGGNGARVAVSNQNQLGTGPVIVNSGSQLYVQAGSYANNLSLNGIGWLETSGNLGALRIDNGSMITGNITLAGNSRIGTSSTATISGNISGSFGIEKTQAGTIILSGNNTFTGGITIQSGIVQLGSAGALNTAAPNAVNFGASSTGILRLNGNQITVSGLNTNATVGTPIVENSSATSLELTVNNATTSTFAGVLQNGAGTGFLALRKAGAGTLILSGANTYTGNTTLTAGVVSVSSDTNLGSLTNGLTFNGGTLQVTGTSFNTNNRLVNWLTNGGGFDIADPLNTFTVSYNLVAGGSLTKLGAGTLVLSGANNYLNSTNINAGVLRINSDTNLGNANNVINYNGGTLQVTSTLTTPRGMTLNAGGGSIDVTTGNTLTQTGVISGAGALTKLGVGTLVLSGTNTYTGGTSLAGPSGSTVRVINTTGLGATSNSLNINAGNTLDVNGNSIGIGALSGAGTITNSSTTAVTLTAGNGNGTSTFSGVIQNGSQTVSLVKTGTGTLTLSGANTYTGGTTLNAGSVSVGSDTNLGGSGGLTFNGGVLQITGTTFTSTPRSIIWGASGGGFDIANAAHTFTVSQPISSGGSLTKLGAGTLVLSGSNNYSGSTNLNAGILSVSNNANLGNTNTTLVFNGGTLQANSSFTTARGTTLNAGGGTINVTTGNTLTHGGFINGTGTLTKTGAGTLVLSGANAYTGGTILAGPAGSTLRLDNSSALGAITNSLAINAGNTLDVNGIFSNLNIGALTGSGTVTNNHPSNIGELRVGNGNVSSTFNGVLQDGPSQGLTLVKVGTGTIALNGSTSNYSVTSLEGGTLSISNLSNLGTDTNFFAAGSVLQYTGTSDTYSRSLNLFESGVIEVTNPATRLTLSGSVFNFGSLTKSGAGTLVLSGSSNDYAGGTILNAGTLAVSSNINLGNNVTALTFNGGTLQITGTTFTSTPRNINWGANGGGFDIADPANTFTITQNLGAGGSLTKLGAGTLVLTGISTDTGSASLNIGMVRVASNTNLGNTNTSLVFNGGTLQTTSSFTTARNTTLNAGGGTIDVTPTNTFTHSGVMGGTGALTKTGAGTLTLSGTNTYTGGTSLNAGIVRVSSDANLGNSSGGLIFNGGTLQATSTITTARSTTLNASGGTIDVTGSNILTHSGVMAGTGAITKAGTGTLVLSGNSTYSGGTTVSRGTLQAASDSNLGTGNVTVASLGNLVFTGNTTTSKSFDLNNGSLRTTAGQTLTFNNAALGGGFLTGTFATQAGASTTFAGNTLNTSGALTLAGSDSLSNFVNSGVVNVNTAADSPTGSSFNNQPAGRLNISNGTMSVADFQSAGQINVTANGTLVNSGSTPITLGGGSISNVGIYNPSNGQVTQGGTIDIDSRDIIVQGGLLRNNGVITGAGKLVVDFGGVAKGAGDYDVGGIETRNGGQILFGNSPGLTRISNATFIGSSIIGGDFNNATGIAGAFAHASNGHTNNSGWSALEYGNASNDGGSLIFQRSSDGPVLWGFRTTLNDTIGDTPGLAANFDPSLNYSWLIARPRTDASSFNPDPTSQINSVATIILQDENGNMLPSTDANLNFVLQFDASHFANATHGSFSFSFGSDLTGREGSSIFLNYSPTAVPEPMSLSLIAMTAAGAGAWYWRRRRSTEKLYGRLR